MLYRKFIRSNSIALHEIKINSGFAAVGRMHFDVAFVLVVQKMRQLIAL